MSSAKVLAYMGEGGPLTGAPRRLLTLVEGLRYQGFEVVVTTPPDSQLYQIENEKNFSPISLTQKGLLALKNKQLLTNKSIFFRIKIISALVKSNFEFYKMLRSEKIDLVWIRGGGTFAKVGMALFLTRVKVIWDVDGELPSNGVVRILHEIGMFLSSKIIFQYESTGKTLFNDSLNRRYKDNYITIIPGIDLSRLKFINKTEERSCIKIIQVGTICENKNQAFSLRLLGQIKKNHHNLNFNIDFAGSVKDSDYQRELEILIEEYDLRKNVRFLGWCDNVTDLIAGSDILMMPSLSEGVPNTVQEAMAIGISVVASTAGGIPEIINSGETGYSIDLDFHEAWYEIVMDLINNPSLRNTIGANAIEYAIKNFDNQVWVNDYIKVINSIVSF